MIIIVSLVILILIIIYGIARLGRERTLSFAIKVLSPICIIIFYLSNFSIILSILNLFNITNSTISATPSIRVAIDSAIITLLINTLVEFFNTPISIQIENNTSCDMEQVRTYIDRLVHVRCNVTIDYKKSWIKKIYSNHGNIVLYIKNSKYTSIAIDRADQYNGCINSQNSSKQIEINLNQISNSDETVEKIYFKLDIVSNVSIKWDDVITYDVKIKNKYFDKTKKLFIDIKKKSIKVIHRESDQGD